MALAAHVFAVVGIGLAVTGRNRTAVVGSVGLAVKERNRRAVVVGISLAVTERSRSAALVGHCVGGGVRFAEAISLSDLGIALVAHAHVWTLCRGHPTDGHH